MNFFLIAVVASFSAVLSYFAGRKFYLEIIKKKASRQLEEILFPKGEHQKHEMLQTFRLITNDRFSDTEMLDYFLKIKGLQNIDINSETNFWIKKYLFHPTAIKLNYFEQVNFYKTFLNYPADEEKSFTEKSKPVNRLKKAEKGQRHQEKLVKTIKNTQE